MSAESITLADLARLNLQMELATHDVRQIRLRAMDGQIGPEEAAAEVAAIMEKLNKAAS